MRRTALMLVWVLGVTSSVLAGPPGWVRKPPRDMANMLYATGMASGMETVEAGRKAAIADAMGDIARRVEMEVQTRFEAIRTAISRQVEDEIRMRSPRVRLTGSLVQAWDFKREKDGRFSVWVLLALPRSALEQAARQQAEAEAVRALETDEAYRRAAQAERSGRVQEAVNAHVAALNLGADQARTHVTDMLGRLRMEAVTGHSAVRAFLIVDGQTVPAQGVPVLFLDMDGERIDTGITNAQGYAETTRMGAVEAQIDIEKLIGARMPNQGLPHIRVKLDIPRRDVRVAVQIVEMRDGQERAGTAVEGRIATVLAAAGFRIMTGGRIDIRVEGRCEVRLNPNPLFGIPSAVAVVHLRAVRTDGTVICFVSTPEIAGFGNDALAAMAAVLRQAAKEAGRQLVMALDNL